MIKSTWPSRWIIYIFSRTCSLPLFSRGEGVYKFKPMKVKLTSKNQLAIQWILSGNIGLVSI